MTFDITNKDQRCAMLKRNKDEYNYQFEKYEYQAINKEPDKAREISYKLAMVKEADKDAVRKYGYRLDKVKI